MQRAAGSVIIENGKILLVREEKPYGSEFFMLPGGKINEEKDTSPEETAKREALEEIGCEIEIEEHIADLVVNRPSKEDESMMLIHFKAKRLGDIQPGKEIIEWGWYDIDNLPENCAPNVEKIVEMYREKYL